jgi:uncharacterized protein (DUF58 family)
VPFPTVRAGLLLAAGAVVALAGAGSPAALALAVALDAAVAILLAVDAVLAPRPGAVRAARALREPLSAFAANAVRLRVESVHPRPLRLEVADAPPASFDVSPLPDRDGGPGAGAGAHRRVLALAPGAAVDLAYEVTPRARGRAAFGDLHVRAAGPLGLAARQWAVALARPVRVYPDLRGLAALPGAERPEAGRARARGHLEGREFAALRGYVPGDDVRSIDWKATARRGAPVVREWQPERNQTIWLLLDCGRHLSARLSDGRAKLDHAVDAALALARAAALRGDRAGALLFGAEVERVVPPRSGRAQLGPVAEALHLAEARLEEADYGAALDALEARQRRRALVVIFTDLADPDTSALLLARAAHLRRRHLVLVAAVADSEVADVAASRPGDDDEAFARAAAERILEEREAAVHRLAASGVRVESVPARELAAAVVARYADVKARGEL